VLGAREREREVRIQEAIQRNRLGRRGLLRGAGGAVAGLSLGTWGWTGLRTGAAPRTASRQEAGFGSLVPDPKGRLALPRGFQYRELSAEGSAMAGGGRVPSSHDGMAAFAGPRGTVVLVRNHELAFEGSDDPNVVPVVGRNPYSAEQWGGTTGVVVDIAGDRSALDTFVTSSGTAVNCAGGPTPWGTWLTCEEVTPAAFLEDGFTAKVTHGYVFEVDPSDPENELSRTPIKEMGLFSHEAMGYDPETGIVYLTEDGETAVAADPREDTGGSFLFRFIPTDMARRPGALQNGGTLQALKAEEVPVANDADLFGPGQRFGVVWVDIDPEGPTEDAAGKDCLKFNRLEGAWFAGGALWFCDTNGGEQRLGQIFRYIPATNTLELFYEGDDSLGTPVVEDYGQDTTRLESPDNITVTPWGDVLVAEDGGGVNRLIGFTPEGQTYVFAEHDVPFPFLEEEELPETFRSEVAGPTFSPDGQTLFFNVQVPGVTFAVWGPFPATSVGATRARRMSVAAPPARLAPSISGELAEAADRHRLSVLEAAAFNRLGVPIL
jgi:hypothetical protein